MKKKKKLSHIQKFILITIFSILFVILSFFLVNKFLRSKTNELKSQNDGLQAQYDELQVYIEGKSQYIRDTESNNKDALAIVNNYASGVTKNSTLHYMENLLSDYKLTSSSVSLNDPEDVTSFVVEGNEYPCQKTGITITYEMKYSTFKEFIRDLREKESKIFVDNLSIAPNFDNNSVSGQLSLIQYSIAGSENEYEEPNVEIPVGVDSIFNFDRKSKVNKNEEQQ